MKSKIIYGIQGGKGSFNEEALRFFVEKESITDYSIKYLHTSENVMKALIRNEIDVGQMAIHNSLGGIVDESLNAIAKYKCTIEKQFAIKIAHAIMIKADAEISDISTIMTHPQVLAQCKNNLAKKYPHLILTSGDGELIDHALVAKRLGEGELGEHIATMGSKVLAEIYNLKIVETDLQDADENYTSFLHVKLQ